MKTTIKRTHAFTYVIMHNGREVENIHPLPYFQKTYAELAGQDALDDMCPVGSPNREAYRVEIRAI